MRFKYCILSSMQDFMDEFLIYAQKTANKNILMNYYFAWMKTKIKYSSFTERDLESEYICLEFYNEN